jgi:hypothetical protein
LESFFLDGFLGKDMTMIVGWDLIQFNHSHSIGTSYNEQYSVHTSQSNMWVPFKTREREESEEKIRPVWMKTANKLVTDGGSAKDHIPFILPVVLLQNRLHSSRAPNCFPFANVYRYFLDYSKANSLLYYSPFQ